MKDAGSEGTFELEDIYSDAGADQEILHRRDDEINRKYCDEDAGGTPPAVEHVRVIDNPSMFTIAEDSRSEVSDEEDDDGVDRPHQVGVGGTTVEVSTARKTAHGQPTRLLALENATSSTVDPDAFQASWSNDLWMRWVEALNLMTRDCGKTHDAVYTRFRNDIKIGRSCNGDVEVRLKVISWLLFKLQERIPEVSHQF